MEMVLELFSIGKVWIPIVITIALSALYFSKKEQVKSGKNREVHYVSKASILHQSLGFLLSLTIVVLFFSQPQFAFVAKSVSLVFCFFALMALIYSLTAKVILTNESIIDKNMFTHREYKYTDIGSLSEDQGFIGDGADWVVVGYEIGGKRVFGIEHFCGSFDLVVEVAKRAQVKIPDKDNVRRITAKYNNPNFFAVLTKLFAISLLVSWNALCFLHK